MEGRGNNGGSSLPFACASSVPRASGIQAVALDVTAPEVDNLEFTAVMGDTTTNYYWVYSTLGVVPSCSEDLLLHPLCIIESTIRGTGWHPQMCLGQCTPLPS